MTMHEILAAENFESCFAVWDWLKEMEDLHKGDESYIHYRYVHDELNSKIANMIRKHVANNRCA